MENKDLIVGIAYNNYSENFFIDFSNENGYIVSVKITQSVAENLSKSLGLKIMIK